ncbi:Vms1/Ankzf1 family peptidyl-tRNA hydrolase [Nocardioides sp.]|uniref:baeRF2 domain-containing protein n=1 Tax=Nocardioides sp. TaxID=35761 RepID=UPI0027331129|nr:Vms1/Ankzf1 family peptidyl-tRNA hydrolase [Nocardioides sp.]MDP3892311.1 Vms1/Ankzf1 family peptidyl-tRNA hydrolase [Nocardioides sp.]
MKPPTTAPLSALRPAADLYGDVVTAYVDVSRTNEDGVHEVEVHAENLRRQLLDAGADDALVESVSARVLEPTGLGGETSRVIVAHGNELVTDALLAGAFPTRAHHGPIAHLLDLARATADELRYAVVRVDRTGADITVAGTAGPDRRELASEGDHDVLHKYKGGGWSHRRFQMRVEDSIERNAEAVAGDLDSLVVNERIDVVLLAGEPTSCSSVRESAGAKLAERLEILEHGGRAEGATDERLDEDVAAALERRRTARLDVVLERLGGGAKAVGVGETVEALRRGEVETLLLLEGALEGRQAYVGAEPLLLGHSPEELQAFGVDEPAITRLDEAMVRAAIGQDADLVPLRAPVGLLPDGVGAVLRFDSRPELTST